jgi:hypothetical protein
MEVQSNLPTAKYEETIRYSDEELKRPMTTEEFVELTEAEQE